MCEDRISHARRPCCWRKCPRTEEEIQPGPIVSNLILATEQVLELVDVSLLCTRMVWAEEAAAHQGKRDAGWSMPVLGWGWALRGVEGLVDRIVGTVEDWSVGGVRVGLVERAVHTAP